MSDSISTLDDEADDEPIGDSREACWFWESRAGRCRYEQFVTGIGSPCADCPEEEPAPTAPRLAE